MGWFSFLRGIIKNCSHQVPQQIKVNNKLYNFHAAETRYEKMEKTTKWCTHINMKTQKYSFN